MPTFRDLQHAYHAAGIIPQGNYMAFSQKEQRRPLEFGQSPFIHKWKLVSYERWDHTGMFNISIVRELTEDETRRVSTIYWESLAKGEIVSPASPLSA